MPERDGLHELIRSVIDVREWLARLDAKLDNMADIKETADNAQETARQAKAIAEENARDIAEMKSDRNRMWGAIAGGVITFIGSLFYFLLTK